MAQTQIVERKRNTFIPFKKGQKVWLDTQHKNKISQEDGIQKRRTI